ncbi:probable pectinesterase/pectinesterase inhibitor 21 [Cucurbita moschata]|uniref:Pectinesterase n=1 Tax=Cucurbita moschata TaxID=3662 RepID=A0A6J1GCB8_CUCMO|nr:probable pectinesterase/pectinesterase inhibitor 21 [Cucurbita moschata]
MDGCSGSLDEMKDMRAHSRWHDRASYDGRRHPETRGGIKTYGPVDGDRDDKMRSDVALRNLGPSRAAVGSNFIGKDLWFENSAGLYKGQAVALRVQSDMSIFYNCRMDGYQDTFYPHAKRQFYRDCTISGTVDFIFGNAAVVLQNCKILVRKPKPKQPCPITAQGRMESDEPTGIVLQNCTISSDPDYYPVRHTSKSYLGRPWKQYSRTVIMQCQIDDLIQPEGWLPWNGDFALNTLYYTEFDNRGPGAAKENRVKWKGVKQITAKQAINFTPSLFIQGDDWIKNTGIPYTSALMKI